VSKPTEKELINRVRNLCDAILRGFSWQLIRSLAREVLDELGPPLEEFKVGDIVRSKITDVKAVVLTTEAPPAALQIYLRDGYMRVFIVPYGVSALYVPCRDWTKDLGLL
jgi:hypothetical protein